MSLVKTNIGSTPGQKFKVAVENVKPDDGTVTEAPRCEWLGQHDEDADEVMQKSRDNRQVDRQVEKAEAFIRTELCTGIKKASELYTKADKQKGMRGNPPPTPNDSPN